MSEPEKVPRQHVEDTNSSPDQDVGDDIKRMVTSDSVHADLAAGLLARHVDEGEWTEEEERKLVRKIDLRLVPIMFLTYGLQYYDKAMISQAALFGLRTELQLTGNRYSFSSSIFYLGYISGTLPAMLLAQRFPVERVTAGIISVWGVTLLCTIACQNYQALYAQRFFLGFLEAGISPILMIIVSSFYLKKEQPTRMGAWWAAAGVVSMFAPLINYGLGHIHGALSQWKYMYIFAGALTVLWSLVVLVYLPPDPIRARGFSERERYIAVARLRVNNAGVRNTHFKPAQAMELVYDPRFWLTFSMGYCIMVANGPMSTFVPIIISGFGYTPLNSLLLAMPVGAVAAVTSILLTWLASKLSGRGWHTWLIVVGQVPTIVASVLLWQLPRHQQGARLFALYLLGSFAAPYGLLMALHSSNTAGYTKKTVTASGLFIGYCLGNFTGPLLFKASDAPGFEQGFRGVVITALIAFVLSVVYRYVSLVENKRRDKAGIKEGFDHAFEDDLTDMKNPQFRYTL